MPRNYKKKKGVNYTEACLHTALEEILSLFLAWSSLVSRLGGGQLRKMFINIIPMMLLNTLLLLPSVTVVDLTLFQRLKNTGSEIFIH